MYILLCSFMTYYVFARKLLECRKIKVVFLEDIGNLFGIRH